MRSATPKDARGTHALPEAIFPPNNMSHLAIQEECYEANLQLPEFDLVDLTFGNVSVIDRGSGVFGIKPSGVDYTKLKPEDIVLVDLEGQKVSGTMRPSSDTPTHRRFFQAFASIRAVVHTHSRNAVVVCPGRTGDPCLGTTHADYFYGEVPVTRPMTPKKSAAPTNGKPAMSSSNDSATSTPNRSAPSWSHGHGPFAWGILRSQGGRKRARPRNHRRDDHESPSDQPEGESHSLRRCSTSISCASTAPAPTTVSSFFEGFLTFRDVTFKRPPRPVNKGAAAHCTD